MLATGRGKVNAIGKCRARGRLAVDEKVNFFVRRSLFGDQVEELQPLLIMLHVLANISSKLPLGEEEPLCVGI